MTSDIKARIRARFPLDEAWAEVWTGRIHCPSCGRETRFVSSIQIEHGRWSNRFSLAELGMFGDLFDSLCEPLLPLIFEFRIARRPSVARGRWCLSNGCTHCGAFIGEYENFDDWADKEMVETVPVRLDAAWRRAMLEEGDERKWARAPRRRVG